MMSEDYKRYEGVIRRRAKKFGYFVTKSCERTRHFGNRGLYMLLDDKCAVLLGESYDATLSDIAVYLDELLDKPAAPPPPAPQPPKRQPHSGGLKFLRQSAS